MTSGRPFKTSFRLLGLLAAVCLLLADLASAGTITGQIRTPTGGTINRGAMGVSGLCDEPNRKAMQIYRRPSRSLSLS